MRRYWIIGLLLMIVSAHAAFAVPTVIDVTYSHHQVWDGTEPDQTYPEGSVIATFTANNPIVLAVPNPLFTRIDGFSFEYTFAWDEAETLTVEFQDSFHEFVEASAFPEPAVELDPALHTLPIVHFTTAPGNLWDPETGIYVWGNNQNCFQHGLEWERPVMADFYDSAGNLFASRDISFRIHGNFSRHFLQKSMRMYFDHGSEPAFIDHDFFGSLPTGFRRLLLRNCRYPDRTIKDNFAQSIYLDLGHLGSRYAYSVVYLNGEYWGLYSMRERIDDEYIEFTHDLDDAGYTLIKDAETLNGDAYEWWSLLDWVSDSTNCESHEFFQQVDNQLDLTSYIDWLFFNIFMASADNGSSVNLAVFKPGDLKWQYIMWDEDNIMLPMNLDANLFRFYSSANEQEFNLYRPSACFLAVWGADTRRHCLLFNHLMRNAEFRAMFAERGEELLSTILQPGALASRLAAIAEQPVSELVRHAERMGWDSADEFSNLVNFSEQWLNDRYPIVVAQFEEFMADSRANVELNHFEALTDGSEIQLNWRTEQEMNNIGFIVHRRVQGESDFQEIASYQTNASLRAHGPTMLPTEYSFNDPSPVPDLINYYKISHMSYMGEIVHDWITRSWTDTWHGLLVNEFMASNTTEIADETGQFEDWVEIYNATTTPIDLDGLFLTDEYAIPAKWEFPSVILDPGDFLLVWCDDDLQDGRLHAPFKLAAGGEQIGIVNRTTTGYRLVDGYTFGPQTTDVSEGRLFDGGLPWVFFPWPTPGVANPGSTPVDPDFSMPTPGVANYPNPFNPTTTIHFVIDTAGPVRLQIFDVAGQHLRTLVAEDLTAGRHSCTWDGTNSTGQPLASGVYYCRLTRDSGVTTGKMVLVR